MKSVNTLGSRKTFETLSMHSDKACLRDESLAINDIVQFPAEISTTSGAIISIRGLVKAARNIFSWLGKALLIMILSLTCALLFWHIRAWIPGSVTYSYKAYVIWLDSSIFGVVPSLWVQQYCRIEFLDRFLRGVWFSYVFVLIFGSTFIFILRGQTQRHSLSVILTLSGGLLVHYILPTQPPWMAVDEVIRINGALYTSADKNLLAAMPSIHQAIICLMGCALWKYRIYGRVISVAYNIIMIGALVYLGEHYVVDAIAGIIIAILSWVTAEKILNWLKLF
jgi:hypothetical protein